MTSFKENLNKLLLFIVSFLLIAMTVLVLWQVFTRYALKSPVAFTDELVRYILIWCGFFGAAYAFGNRQHVSLTFLKSAIKGKNGHILQIVIDILVIVFVAVVMIYGGINLTKGGINIKTPVLQWSKAVVYVVMPISGVLIILYQITNIYEEFVAFSTSSKKGV